MWPRVGGREEALAEMMGNQIRSFLPVKHARSPLNTCSYARPHRLGAASESLQVLTSVLTSCVRGDGLTAEEPPRKPELTLAKQRHGRPRRSGKILRLQPNQTTPRCSPTVSITTQRPHVVDRLRAGPVGVPDHYLAHRQVVFVGEESGVISPAAEEGRNKQGAAPSPRGCAL